MMSSNSRKPVVDQAIKKLATEKLDSVWHWTLLLKLFATQWHCVLCKLFCVARPRIWPWWILFRRFPKWCFIPVQAHRDLITSAMHCYGVCQLWFFWPAWSLCRVFQKVLSRSNSPGGICAEATVWVTGKQQLEVCTLEFIIDQPAKMAAVIIKLKISNKPMSLYVLTVSCDATFLGLN